MIKRLMYRAVLACILSLVISISAIGVNAQDKPKLPTPPGAINVVSTPGSLTFATTLSVKEVVAFYTQYFRSINFTVTTNQANSGGTTGAAVQYTGPNGQVVNLVVSSQDGVTGVVIGYRGNFDASVSAGNNNPGTDSSTSTASYVPVTRPLNIELIFDASGSMDEALGGSTRIEAARQAVQNIAAALPNDAKVHIGMRVFGQAGNNTDAGRAESCASTKLLVPIESNAGAKLVQAAKIYEPTGWTPIALALNAAANDFTPNLGTDSRNVLILVSDGEETCGGDPGAVAKLLYASKAKITTHVVAIATTTKVAPVMSKISANGGGVFLNANQSVELAGGIIGLVSSEVSNAGGTFVLPESVSAKLSVTGGSGKISITGGKINISGLVKSSSEIGQVSIQGSLARLNVTAGGTSINLDGINGSVSIQTSDGGSITVNGDGSTTVEDDSGSVSIGPNGITITEKGTATPDD